MSVMSKVKIMDELLANKIAAGEVVERCANVVKELVENSIDAKSTEIKVELIDSGIKQIKVTDNGIGMDKEDAILCFSRHATSKIVEEDDLYHIQTLGFRGEALASIASVSEILLKTSNGKVGTIVSLSGGVVINIEDADLRKGTIMTVSNLFYNTPARLKHLKSLYAELANITDYMNKIALSHPQIRFTLVNNENVILKTDGKNQLLKTINSIYGMSITKKMMDVHAEDDDYIIDGYISFPEVHRSSRNNMVTLVNGRVIKNTEINRVINDAYHSYKPDNRYPVVVLNIEVDPSLIDVNVHPTKMEIKFSKFEEIKNLINSMITKKLKLGTFIPEVEEETVPNFEKNKYVEQTLDLNRVQEDEETYVILDESEKQENLFELSNFLDKKEEKYEEKKQRLPELYPVGLVHGTYIICQNELGMYLIDQHAAKERCNYEMYKYIFGHPSGNTVPMLFPFTLELSNSEYIILKENFDFLRNLGFDISEFGINSIIIKSHPTWLKKGFEEEAIRKIIDVILSLEKKFTVEKFNEKAATMLSCKKAIKGNENITIKEMEELINDLRKCENPFNCPHGRPTIIFYSKYELEKLFKRSGF